MGNPKFLLIMAGLLVSLSCTPLIRIDTKPRGLDVKGQCVLEGETIKVIVNVIHINDPAPWRIQFKEDGPLEVKTEHNELVTSFTWKVAKDRLAKRSLKPYVALLISEKLSYSATIKIENQSFDLSGTLLFSLVRL
jgi:hypothetical protein